MQVFLLLTLLLSAPAIDVDLAPDQPLPYVYVDDPLILELQSTEDCQANVQLSVQALQHPQATEVSLGPLTLRARGNFWSAVQGLPADRGFYATKVHVTAGDAAVDKAASFCRIDRIGVLPALPLSANSPDPAACLALTAVGVRAVQYNASDPSLETRARSAAAAGLQVCITIDCANLPAAPDTAAHLVQLLGGSIARWEIAAQDNGALLNSVIDAMRAAGCNAPIAAAIPTAETLTALIASAGNRCTREITVLADAPATQEIEKLAGVSEDSGCESWRITVRGKGVPSENAGARLATQILRNISAGAAETGFDPALAYDGEIHESLAYLNGLAQRFPAGAEFAGALDAGANASALVFRKGTAWFAAAWSENAENSLSLNLGEAQTLVLTDAFNNPLPVPKPDNGAVRLRLTKDPVYLSGSAGPVCGEAARNRAMALAARFNQDPRFQALPPELLAAATAIAANPAGPNARQNFLALVRFFPQFEQQLQTGALPKQTVVPAMAQLSRLIRALCAIEQDRGEAFLDPLQDTLARCEEYQSQYLTGSTGGSQAHERGDWLLTEVRRLMDTAEDLSAADLRIEAAAVAMLAEWRARGLEFAAAAEVAPPPAPPQQNITPAAAPAEPPPAAETPKTEEPPQAEDPPKAETAVKSPPTEPTEAMHTVARGETPESIAQQYSMPVDDFLKLNGIKKGARIKAGKQYKVIVQKEQSPKSSPEPGDDARAAPAESPAGKSVHVVAKGEYPSSIAAKYGISVEDLLKWNQLTAKSTLSIGQQLVINKDAAGKTGSGATDAPDIPKGTKEITHTVARGENPSAIARKYGVSLEDFLKWNGLDQNARFQVGEKYKVYVPEKRGR